MSRLPKKKSRPITVNDTKYRWLLKGYDRYGTAPRVLTISIQEDTEKPGQTLQCSAVSNQYPKDRAFDYYDDNYGTCSTSIITSDIRKLILAGLEQGWAPREGNGKFDVKNVLLNEYTVE